MTLLHMPFDEAATYYGWDNLVTFSRHLPADSATHRALGRLAVTYLMHNTQVR